MIRPIRYSQLYYSYSLLPTPYSLFPVPRSAVPCSLKPRTFYLTQLIYSISLPHE
ncbi:MAG: hypothetical protein F6J98_28265 [Moorea sp. SIO4G2]|nr:hypothetical protein [Moorena sp. SIO4G2]